MAMGASILLVDDHLMFRQCLARALNEQSDLRVTAEAESLQTARRVFRPGLFDVILLDLHLADGSGLDFAREVGSQCPVLMLSMSLDDHAVTASLDAGAQGYIPKTGSVEDLFRALRALVAGSPFIHPLVSGAVLRHFRPDRQALTERERSILMALSRGEGTSSIAVDLNVSASTVKTHMRALYQKLSARNRAEAVSRALESGLISNHFRA